MVVPDNQKYTLKYVYGVSGDIVREQPYTVINTASIEGIKTGSDECKKKWETYYTSGTAKTDRSYVINKVDADNYGLGLANAVFTVYKYDGDDNDSNDKAIATYTTDAKVTLQLRNQICRQHLQKVNSIISKKLRHRQVMSYQIAQGSITSTTIRRIQ